MDTDRIIPMNQNSDKWGNCEICGKYVSHTHKMNLRDNEVIGKMRVVRGHRNCIIQAYFKDNK